MPGRELECAGQCERYFDAVIRPERLWIGRDKIASGLEELYARRLGLPEGADRAARLAQKVEEPGTVLVEIAHDGQIPHLGVVRMVLKTEEIARGMSNGLALYLIGDHYSAEMRPRNLYLGLPLRGVDADHVKTPFTISVGKKHRSVPFDMLPPPSQKVLDELEARAEQWVEHNATFSKRASAAVSVKSGFRAQFELLRESARRVKSFGDWLMRVQISWFDLLFGESDRDLLVLPMTGIRDWLPEILEGIARAESVLGGGAGQEPGSDGRLAPGGFWVYCHSCLRRNRATWHEGVFEGTCVSCGSAIRARWPRDSSRVMPDIVAFEQALFHSGVSGWVVGSRAPYLPVIEEKYRSRFGRTMPPTFLLDSIPVFHGLGEPLEGHTRARVLRVLAEMDPGILRELLSVPWEISPVVRSPFL